MNNSTTFADGASTAMLIANTYRLALVADVYSSALSSVAPAGRSLTAAEASYQALTANNRHISPDGVLSPVTDPLSFKWELEAGQVSPEGEAFVLLMEAARRDFIANGGKVDSSGGNADSDSSSSGTRTATAGWFALLTLAAAVPLSLYL